MVSRSCSSTKHRLTLERPTLERPTLERPTFERPKPGSNLGPTEHRRRSFLATAHICYARVSRGRVHSKRPKEIYLAATSRVCFGSLDCLFASSPFSTALPCYRPALLILISPDGLDFRRSIPIISSICILSMGASNEHYVGPRISPLLNLLNKRH